MAELLGIAIGRSSEAQAAWLANDDNLLMSILNQKDIFVKDETYWTTRQLAVLLTDEEYNIVHTTINQFAAVSPKLADSYMTLRTTGLPFGDPIVISMITTMAVAASWPQDLTNKMLALGGVYKSIADQVFTRDITQNDIDAYRTWTIREKLLNDFSKEFHKVQSALDQGNRALVITELRNFADYLEE